ncbi:MAG TPA: DUF2059 domain-containing protein [Candidatus Elarobacter sp.]|nr:DUF2059 domain-containing protein [Candidatus Elarobacter sp.]
MKNILVALLLCLALCATGLAQNPADQPATKADIDRYLEAIHSREMIGQMVVAMSKPIQKMLHDQYEKNKDKLPADFEARTSKEVEDMLKEMPWEDMLQAMVPAYQKHFTRGDMDALTAFYSSPTGQKVMREMPGLMADSMEIMMPIMSKHVEKVAARMQEEVLATVKESEKPHSPAAVPAK